MDESKESCEVLLNRLIGLFVSASKVKQHNLKLRFAEILNKEKRLPHCSLAEEECGSNDRITALQCLSRQLRKSGQFHDSKRSLYLTNRLSQIVNTNPSKISANSFLVNICQFLIAMCSSCSSTEQTESSPNHRPSKVVMNPDCSDNDGFNSKRHCPIEQTNIKKMEESILKGDSTSPGDSPIKADSSIYRDSDAMYSYGNHRTDQSNRSAKASDVPFEVVFDLLCAMQGIEGSCFSRLDDDETASTNTSSSQLVLNNDCAMVLDRCSKAQINRFLEIGRMFITIQNSLTCSKESDGHYTRALKIYLREELNEFCSLLSMISQIVKEDGVCHMHAWLWDAFNRLKILNYILCECKDLKGGMVLSALHRFHQTSHRAISEISGSALLMACAPFFRSLLSWILCGSLDENDVDFFVKEDPNCNGKTFWTSRYYIDQSQLPAFISTQTANKILFIGKSLNFMSQLCDEGDSASQIEMSDVTLSNYSSMYTDSPGTNEFSLLVDTCHAKASSKTLQLLFNKYRLMCHFMAIRNYLFLAKSDFARNFLDDTFVQLNKPADKLNFFSLRSSLDSSLRSTQVDEDEFVFRIDVKILPPASGEIGWDVFSLEYSVDGPLQTIFPKDVTIKYSRVFHFLWKFKRIDFVMSRLWTHLFSLKRRITQNPLCRQFLQQCYFQCQLVRHFVAQLDGYFMYEVIESGWQDFYQKLPESIDLDMIISVNQKWVTEITDGLALSDNVKASTEFLFHLRSIYTNILRFDEIVRNFIQEVEEVSTNEENLPSILPSFESEMTDVSMQFQEQVNSLMNVAFHHPVRFLKFLKLRLDYNNFYSMANASKTCF